MRPLRPVHSGNNINLIGFEGDPGRSKRCFIAIAIAHASTPHPGGVELDRDPRGWVSNRTAHSRT